MVYLVMQLEFDELGSKGFLLLQELQGKNKNQVLIANVVYPMGDHDVLTPF